MIAGIGFGLVLGDATKPLAEIGKILIQLIKMIAVPLLFFTILTNIIKSDFQLKDAKRLFFFAFLNAIVALGIGLLLSNWIEPGKYLNFSPDPNSPKETLPLQKIDWLLTLKSYIPTSIISPFQDNSVIPAVLLALILGAALRKSLKLPEFSSVRLLNYLELGLKAIEQVLLWILKLIPLAVFFLVAYAVGKEGFKPFQGLFLYVLVAIVGMAFHSLFTYQLWLKLYVKMPLFQFWKAAIEPATHAFGTNSSLATLPLTLKALKNLKVSDRASSLGACVGTNLNNDGIILYEAMAVLFVAQAHGIDLSVGEQIYAGLLCLVAAIGVAGIPEAGFVSLSLVLTTVGMPMELLPLLLTVDWFVARARSTANTLSDMLVSILIDRSLGYSGSDLKG